MFSLLDQMKWNHLPRAGGISEQDPDFLNAIRLIFTERNEFERKKQANEERRRKVEQSASSRRRR